MEHLPSEKLPFEMFRLAVEFFRILHYLTLQCSQMDPIRLKSTLILGHQVPVWITSLRLFLSFHGFSFKNRISKCLVIYLKANIIATSTNDFIVIFKATIFRIWTTIKSHFPSTKTNEQFSTNFLSSDKAAVIQNWMSKGFPSMV